MEPDPKPGCGCSKFQAGGAGRIERQLDDGADGDPGGADGPKYKIMA